MADSNIENVEEFIQRIHDGIYKIDPAANQIMCPTKLLIEASPIICLRKCSVMTSFVGWVRDNTSSAIDNISKGYNKMLEPKVMNNPF